MPKGVHGRRLTDKQRITFLAALAAGKTVRAAAVFAGIDDTYVYAVKRVDEDFAEEWADAMRLRNELRADKVRDKAYEVAMDDDHKAQAQILGKLLDSLPEHKLPDQGHGADGVAEAIDRFTATVEHATVEHRRGLTVADLVADPRAAVLVQATLRELSPGSPTADVAEQP